MNDNFKENVFQDIKATILYCKIKNMLSFVMVKISLKQVPAVLQPIMEP